MADLSKIRLLAMDVDGTLTDGGVLHFHCYVGRDSLFSRSLYKTLASVFPSVVVLGESEFFASTAPLHLDTADLQERAAHLRHFIPDIDERIGTLRMTPPRVDDVPLLTDDFAPVDSLLRGIPLPPRRL